MLKIKKHKKKKGKKGTEDDLFDPANLETFKKELEAKKLREQQEQQEHPDQQTQASSSASNAAKDHDKEEDDEWKKFKALTAGVDSIIQKSSGELERIKKSSVFQRKAPPPPPSPPKVIPKEDPEEALRKFREPYVSKNKKPDSGVDSSEIVTVTVPEPEPEPPQEIELDDSLFDTTFVDAIASGEIKLNYIPDSPVEDPSGDDPFDTSALGDVIKKVEEEIKKKAKQINLGGVVEYLTGKSDKPTPLPEPLQLITPQPVKSSKRPRRCIPQNVDLLGTFDDDKQTEQSPSPVSNNPSEIKEKDKGVDLNELLKEFDAIESTTEDLSKLNPLELLSDTAELGDHLGETLTTRIQGRKKSLAEELQEDDPFDTSSVSVVGLGKSEIRQLEDELLASAEEQQSPAQIKVQDPEPQSQQQQVQFTCEIPRVRPSPPKVVERREIHPLDSIDISEVPPPSLSPAHLAEQVEDKEQDPFDTSEYAAVLPGKLELKFLEDEFVDYTQVSSSNSPNPQTNIELFDPWSSEAQAAALNEPKINIPAIPDDPFEVHPEVAAVADSTIPDDPFVVDTSIAAIAGTELSAPLVVDPWDTSAVPVYTHAKTLDPTPISLGSNSVSQLQLNNDFEDPFDTTYIEDNSKVPHKIELKELESELLKSTTDFQPPAPTGQIWIKENLSKPPRPQPIHHQESLLDKVDIHHEHAPALLPTSSLYSTEEICEDPFDTSIADSIGPGKAELKLLEEHLDF